MYYILGTSLAHGQGYRLLNEPGEIEATIYPPLLPATIAGLQLALGTADPVIVGTWLRGLFAVIFATFVFATYRLLRQVVRPLFAVLASFVCALSFLGLWLSDRCYTDLPFALVLVLLVRERAATGGAGEVRSWLLATSAFLLRTIGIALLAAWAIEALIRRKRRAALVRVAAALLPVIAWQVYVNRVEQISRDTRPAYTYQRADYNIYNVRYGRLFSLRDHLHPEFGKVTPVERVSRAIRGLPSIVAALGGAISQPREQWEFVFQQLNRVPIVRHLARWRLISATTMMLGMIVIAGLGIQLARGECLLPLSVLAYLAGLCSMPHSYYGELPRYVWVLSPLLMLSACAALQAAHRVSIVLPRRARSIGTFGVAGLVTFVMALSVVVTIEAYRSDLRPVVHRDWNGHRVEYRLFSYSDYQAFDGGIEWLKQHASASDVVASTTPHWVYLRTGLKAVFPPFEQNPALARGLLDAVPVRYVVVADWLSRERALPTVESDQFAWRVAYADGDFAIYERTRDQHLLASPVQLER